MLLICGQMLLTAKKASPWEVVLDLWPSWYTPYYRSNHVWLQSCWLDGSVHMVPKKIDNLISALWSSLYDFYTLASCSSLWV
jgi:hypothetical protein